jgi:hypothetical protein
MESYGIDVGAGPKVESAIVVVFIQVCQRSSNTLMTDIIRSFIKIVELICVGVVLV